MFEPFRRFNFVCIMMSETTISNISKLRSLIFLQDILIKNDLFR